MATQVLPRLRPPFRSPLPLRKRVKYNKAVTIAAGFQCADGIVLAVDSQSLLSG